MRCVQPRAFIACYGVAYVVSASSRLERRTAAAHSPTTLNQQQLSQPEHVLLVETWC
jgi:hypothetical protein